MTTRHAVMLALALAMLMGAADAYLWTRGTEETHALDLVWTFAFMIVGYVWYRQDSIDRSYRGSVLLGGAVVFVAVLAIPYYLARSRPAGQKTRAVFGFLGLVLLGAMVSAGNRWLATQILGGLA